MQIIHVIYFRFIEKLYLYRGEETQSDRNCSLLSWHQARDILFFYMARRRKIL